MQTGAGIGPVAFLLNSPSFRRARHLLFSDTAAVAGTKSRFGCFVVVLAGVGLWETVCTEHNPPPKPPGDEVTVSASAQEQGSGQQWGTTPREGNHRTMEGGGTAALDQRCTCRSPCVGERSCWRMLSLQCFLGPPSDVRFAI